jgi:hypothetical protein
MIRGLDNDELKFLEDIDKNRVEQEEIRNREESEAVEAYRKAISDLSEIDQENKVNDFKKSLWASSASSSSTAKKVPAKSSQAALLANAIKRKSDKNDLGKSSEPASKRPAVETLQTLGVLPGIVAYGGTDSEDSDNSSDSENDDELRGLHLLPRMVREIAECAKNK